jgi:hypothetical protein
VISRFPWKSMGRAAKRATSCSEMHRGDKPVRTPCAHTVGSVETGLSITPLNGILGSSPLAFSNEKSLSPAPGECDSIIDLNLLR